MRISKLFNKQFIKLNFLAPRFLSDTSGDGPPCRNDVVIVGGGIVGAASGRKLLKTYPKLRLTIVEKESTLGKHQTGHNSGVIHAGIYYKPGSMKAKLCVKGMWMIYDYCNKKKIPYKKVGKLIVATLPEHLPALHELVKRAEQNKVKDCKVLKGVDEIRKVEPYCNGLEAIHSPHTGIVDFGLVCNHFGEDVKSSGGKILFNFEVNGFKDSGNSDYPVVITAKDGSQIYSKYVFTCAGLYSDTMAQLTGCPRSPIILPVRGEYLRLTPEKAKLVKGNIYPVPDPKFPFLGVHYTPRMNGEMWLGPNAVLALKREGYKWSDIDIKDILQAATFPGSFKLLFKFPMFIMSEIVKSLVIKLQLKDIQQFVSCVDLQDIEKGHSGVRAQALDENGQMIEDFYFDKGDSELGQRILHCRNAPSPGATSSMAIAEMITEKLEKEFNLSKLASKRFFFS